MVREAFGQMGGRLVLLGNVLDSARFLQHGIKLLLLLACLAGWTRSYEIGRRFFFLDFFFRRAINFPAYDQRGWLEVDPYEDASDERRLYLALFRRAGGFRLI